MAQIQRGAWGTEPVRNNRPHTIREFAGNLHIAMDRYANVDAVLRRTNILWSDITEPAADYVHHCTQREGEYERFKHVWIQPGDKILLRLLPWAQEEAVDVSEVNDALVRHFFQATRGLQGAIVGRGLIHEGEQRVVDVALALGLYQLEQGRYPDSLDELVPEYVNRIPLDFATNQPLKYQTDGKEFALYSVGQNQEDDGGVHDPREGDYVVRSSPQ